MISKEVLESEWYQGLPDICKQAVQQLPPDKLYRFKDTGKQCHLVSYDEPNSGLFGDMSVTVQKTGVGGAMAEMGLGLLDRNKVFGVKLEDLEVWDGE